MFVAEADRILGATSGLILHHIGSTSVPGCDAKPIVDIMGEVELFKEYSPVRAALTSRLGYTSLGEYGVPGRDFLYNYAGQMFHISVFERGSPHIASNLKFRDILRSNAELRNGYVDLKRTLAREHSHDMAAYNDRKAALIAEILGTQ
jgi:GrpB-like predicted nucleotidyltransferase (UPF0157 family)